MAKFPEPDLEVIRSVPAELVTLRTDRIVWRVYFAQGAHPVSWDTFRRFGPVAGGRFDHHLPPTSLQRRSVSYLGDSPSVCVAEVFQATRTISETGEPHLVGFRLRRPARLLDLRGLWPTAARGSQAIASGPKARSQRWARVIAEAYGDVDGVAYRSSMHAGDDAWCLWGCRDALPDSPDVNESLFHPGLRLPLHRIASTLGYRVV